MQAADDNAQVKNNAQVNVAVVTVEPPFPVRSGGDIRNARHILAASRLGAVSAISLHGGPREGPHGLCSSSLGTRALRDLWRPLQGSRPLVATLTEDERAAFAAMLTRQRPQVVVLEGIALAGLGDLARGSGAAVVLDMHNIESDLDAQVQRARRPLRTALFGRRPLARRRLAIETVERELSEAVDAVWVCSRLDADRLLGIARPRRIDVVPNVPPEFAPTVPLSRPAAADGPRLVYAGHLGYAPNVRAAQLLAQRILPRIRERLPAASLVLAGREPRRRIHRLAALPGVCVRANPELIAPYLAAADFSVIPLREGGGTRIKIPEAMAAGLVVVASSIAAEGLDLEPGRHAVIADSADEMADAVVRLTADPQAYLAMAEAGRSWAQTAFDPKLAEERIALLLREVAGARVAA
ncbi:MAG: glycosyltransferase [Bauldia sp.]